MNNRTLDDLLFQIEEIQDNLRKVTDLGVAKSDVLEEYEGLTIANWLEYYLNLGTRGFNFNGWFNLVRECTSPQNHTKVYMLSDETARMLDLVSEFYTKKD